MRIFSIGPRIRKKGNRILATTSFLVRILTLGTLFREVAIDPQQEKVHIRNRTFWLFGRTRSVSFKKIQHVTYGYTDESFGASFQWAHDSLDSFSVGLRFHNDSEMRLFTFFGEGTFANNSPFPDWFYWEEYAFDLSGSQEKESRAFVDLLSKMIGVTVVPPRG